jgi:hypothetical protein
MQIAVRAPVRHWRRAVAALATLALTRCSVADDLGDLLARNLEWRGGAAYQSLQTLRIQGALRVAGLSGTVDTFGTARGESYQRADLGVLKQTQAVTNAAGWVTTPSGQVESLAQDVAEDTSHETLLDFLPALESRSDVRLTLRPDEALDGQRWRVVHIDFGGRDGFDLFLDAASGAQHGYRKTQDTKISLVRQSDWRTIEGVRVPFRVEIEAPIAADSSTLSVAHVELNPPLPEHWSQRPSGPGKARLAGGARRSDWVPFDLVEGHLIYFPAEVNGVRTRVLFDSGAASTVIDSRLAARLHIQTRGTLAATGTGGTDTAALAAGVSLRIGSLTLEDLTVAAMPLDKIAQGIGHEVPAIVGQELLNELAVDIDFPHRRIAFERPDAFSAPAGATAVPLKMNNAGLRSVEISVEHEPAILASFDLGNSANPLSLAPAYWKAHGMEHGRRSTVTASGGVGGVNVQPQIAVASLALGGLEFKDVPTELEPTGQTAFESDRDLANIGIEIWSRFHLIADYPHERLYLLPTPDWNSAPFAKDRSGLALERTADALQVRAVAPGSQRAAEGWKVGDRILTVDGKRAASQPSHLWRERSRGTRVALKGTDAEGHAFSRQLVLEDFF